MTLARRILLGASAIPAGLVLWAFLRAMPEPVDDHASPSPSAIPAPPVPPGEPSDEGHDDDRSYVFRIPSGEPTALSCDEARTIVDQVRAGLAYTPEGVKVASFASAAADWLDPHGLYSLAKDAPAAAALTKAAPNILADIEGRRQRGCSSALGPGAVLEAWATELRESFDRGRRAPGNVTVATATLDPLPASGTAKETAEELGRRAGAFEAANPDGKHFADEARRRFFPPLDKEGWGRVVLAAAVRAYVPLVDPHGEWAPFDEESRIYEIDLASRPPSRLWGHAVLTSVGVRITEEPAAPLQTDDVVLAVSHVATAGLPLEQVDQLGFASSDGKTPLPVEVLRAGKITTLQIGREEDAGVPEHGSGDLPVERLAYGDGDVLVIAIKDVKDDLGEDLAAIVADEREHGARKLVGIVLDLRGNGGGSTDGALGALSLFMPGAPLFAMKRRDGTIEIDRAPFPREGDAWKGPVATLVDGTTASAAEMIAGALAAYKRAPTIGTTTFGKGCAQEYVDDDAHAGVLRLTTLVYALPDGSPVQRIGLVPTIRFPFVPVGDLASASEREAKLAHTAPTWRGPDVRDTSIHAGDDAWPQPGTVGPCHDGDVCKALRLLGSPKRAPIAKH